MRSILLIFIGLINQNLIYSQTNDSIIESYLYNENIQIADSLINVSLAEDSTQAKLWFYKGLIEQSRLEVSTPFEQKEIAIKKALNDYKKAEQYDSLKLLSNLLPEQYQDVSQQYFFTAVEFFNAGQAQHALGLFEESLLISVQKLNKIDTLTLYHAAIAAQHSQDYPKAEAYYLTLLKFDPFDIPIAINLIEVWRKMDKLKEIKSLSKYYEDKIPEERIQFTNQLVSYYFEHHQMDSALIELSTIDSTGTHKSFVQAWKGAIAFDQKNYQKSEYYYQLALESDPNNTDAQFNLAILYYNSALNILDQKKHKRQNKKQAKELFSKAYPLLNSLVEIYPDDVQIQKMWINCKKSLEK
jgi:tetratricopeptide (TPR) repeat protein